MTLWAHYPLQENSGDAQDHSGNNYTGTVSGAIQGETGILGATSYLFDGIDDYVDTSSDFTEFSSWSFCAWIKTTDTAIEAIYSKQNDADAVLDHRLLVRDDGSTYKYSLTFELKSGTNVYAQNNDVNYNDGNWHFLAGTWDGIVTGDVRLFFDGEEVSYSDRVSATGTVDPTTSALRLGYEPDGEFPYGGNMAGVRLNDRALSPSEIQYLYEITENTRFVTQKKRYDDLLTPEIRANVTLDGESSELLVIASPDSTAREIKQITLQDGQNTYQPSWSNSHQEFQMIVESSKADPTSRVDVDYIQLRSDPTTNATTLSFTSGSDWNRDQS